MAKATKFLTNLIMPQPRSTSPLAVLTGKLPHPSQPLLYGRRSDALVLPENLACFQRGAGAELNQPQRGRALHHRCVLIVPLKGTVTMCVDDREFKLGPPQALLVLPFQFHHYLPGKQGSLQWLFITFEYLAIESLQGLRFQPFRVTQEIRALITEILKAYLTKSTPDLALLHLAVLLARLRLLKPVERPAPVTTTPSFLSQVSLLVLRDGAALNVKEIGRNLGISTAHL